MKDQGIASLSFEEKKNRVSALLRHVDAEVKTGNLDSALELTRQVYQYDSKNLYARALEERILVMKSDSVRLAQQKIAFPKAPEQPQPAPTPQVKEQAVQQEQKETAPASQPQPALPVKPQSAPVVAPPPPPVVTKQIEDAGQALLHKMNLILEKKQREMEEDFQRRINELKTSVSRPVEANAGSSSPMQQFQVNNVPILLRYIEDQEKELQNKFYIERERIQDEVTQQLQDEQQRVMGEAIKNLSQEYEQKLKSEIALAHNQALEAYRSALAALIHYKIPKLVQQDITRILRQPLSISEEEHSQAEQFARIEAYLQEMRDLYRSGNFSASDWNALSKLQTQLGITEDENKKLTRKVKKELGLPDESDVILVVDDDPVILRSTALLLEQTYLNVVAMDSIEKAVAFLKDQTPDIIVCDVSMPGIGGITFLENIQQGSYGNDLKSVPFVFASGMGDKYIINSAKQLGAKAYITKPFTQELLEQTVKEALA